MHGGQNVDVSRAFARLNIKKRFVTDTALGFLIINIFSKFLSKNGGWLIVQRTDLLNVLKFNTMY